MTLGEALRKIQRATGPNATGAQRPKEGLETLANDGIAALTACDAISTSLIMETVKRRPPEGVAMALLAYVEDKTFGDPAPPDGLESGLRALQSVRAINALPLDDRLSLEEMAHLIGRGWEAGLDHLGAAGSHQGFWRDAATRRSQRQGRSDGGKRSREKRLWWHEHARELLAAASDKDEPKKVRHWRVATAINQMAWRDRGVEAGKITVTERTVRAYDEALRREAKQNRSA